MMQTGIFTAYFPFSLEETAKQIRALDFNTVQLDMQFEDIDLSAGNITVDKCRTIRDTFRDHNLPICAVSGYTNIVHPDPTERSARIQHLKEIISHARDLGSPYVISETGTANPESDWVHHPRNDTEEVWDDCRAIVSELAQFAYDHGAMFLLETYVNNVVSSVERTLRMFAEVDHPGLGLCMDPTNYFTPSNVEKMDETLNYMFDSLTNRIKIAHAKDVKLSGDSAGAKHEDIGNDNALESHTFRGVGKIELPAPGLGVLNYDLYLQRLAQKHPNIPILIEHLDLEDAPRSKQFLDEQLRANGV